MKVICRKNGGESVVFTDGKVYDAEHFKNALYQVIDDLGHVRYIIPGEPCPHIKSRAFFDRNGFPIGGDNSVGVFEEVATVHYTLPTFATNGCQKGEQDV